MVMKNKEGLEKGSEWSSLRREDYPAPRGILACPRTGNDDRGKLGKSELSLRFSSYHYPYSLPLLTRLLHVYKRIMLGEAGW